MNYNNIELEFSSCLRLHSLSHCTAGLNAKHIYSVHISVSLEFSLTPIALQRNTQLSVSSPIFTPLIQNTLISSSPPHHPKFTLYNHRSISAQSNAPLDSPMTQLLPYCTSTATPRLLSQHRPRTQFSPTYLQNPLLYCCTQLFRLLCQNHTLTHNTISLPSTLPQILPQQFYNPDTTPCNSPPHPLPRSDP